MRGRYPPRCKFCRTEGYVGLASRMGLSRCGGGFANAITGGLCDLMRRSRSGVREPRIAGDGLGPNHRQSACAFASELRGTQ
jgi:hypothetical protein